MKSLVCAVLWTALLTLSMSTDSSADTPARGEWRSPAVTYGKGIIQNPEILGEKKRTQGRITTFSWSFPSTHYTVSPGIIPNIKIRP